MHNIYKIKANDNTISDKAEIIWFTKSKKPKIIMRVIYFNEFPTNSLVLVLLLCIRTNYFQIIHNIE